ncbi:MAG: DeoR/GlpR family DNA-binding transcription regulator [Pseudomonadota bacterium]
MPRRNARLIPAQRRALVLDLIRRRGVAAVSEIAQAIGGSFSTVRRDLDELTAQGYMERTHGGALLKTRLRTTFEPGHEIAANLEHAAKVAIGGRAAELVEDGQCVIFDSSSTVLEAAVRVVERDLGLTAVTNDLKIATLLAAAPRIRVIVLGGTVRPGSSTLIGEPGESFIEGLHADLALIGTHSLARQRLGDTSIEIAAIKRRMIAAARHVAVLADSSKFAQPAFCEICPAQAVHRLITDREIPKDDRRALEELGVTVDIAAARARK